MNLAIQKCFNIPRDHYVTNGTLVNNNNNLKNQAIDGLIEDLFCFIDPFFGGKKIQREPSIDLTSSILGQILLFHVANPFNFDMDPDPWIRILGSVS